MNDNLCLRRKIPGNPKLHFFNKQIEGNYRCERTAECHLQREFLEKKLKRWGISGFKIIQSAASTIKIEFQKEDDVTKFMREFIIIARNFVPGIEYSQTFIQKEESGNDENWNEALEEKLNEKKNRPSTLYYPNLMIVKRDNRTALPIRAEEDRFMVKDYNEKDELVQVYMDEANCRKFKKARPAHEKLEGELLADSDDDDSNNLTAKIDSSRELPVKIEEISKNFIAVVHADGNGLGQLLQNQKNNPDFDIKNFSQSLDACTVNSARNAFGYIKEVYDKDSKDKYPFRPIVLGGDDFTFVCKADDAVEFTKRFMLEFEKNSANSSELNKNGGKLTVCAGIAFVKKNYPMYYAYELAESLCSLAKKKAKELKGRKKNLDVIPSCLAFRKELGSFAEDFENIKDKNAEFIFGPYAVSDSGDELPQTDSLLKVVKVLKDNNAFKSFLRNWMSEKLVNPHSAQLLKERFIQVAGEKHPEEYKDFCAALKELVPQENGDLTLEKDGASPVLDILTLISIAEKPETDSKKEGGENGGN